MDHSLSSAVGKKRKCDKIWNGIPNPKKSVTCKRHKTGNENPLIPLKNTARSNNWFYIQNLCYIQNQNNTPQKNTVVNSPDSTTTTTVETVSIDRALDLGVSV